MRADFLAEKIPSEEKKNLEFIQNKIRETGKESYLVGGSVRDLYLKQIPDEYDLATSASPEEIKSIFKKVIETGIKHGTVTVLIKDKSYEITTYRKDKDYTDGRRPDEVEFGVTLSEDLRRRDFTMNALALDLINLELIDEHNGIDDINAKIIKTIGDPVKRFSEDGLRPIRAIRFATKLGFQIEENTYRAILATNEITAKISRERFHDELNKILCSENPAYGCYELARNKIFSVFSQEKPVENLNQANLVYLNSLNKEPAGLRISALIREIKPQGSLSFTESFLKSLKYSNINKSDSIFFLSLFEKIYPLSFESFEARKIFSYILGYSGKSRFPDFCEALYSMYRTLYPNQSEKLISQFKQVLSENPPLVISDLTINGDDIIQKFPEIDKKKIGMILKSLLDFVLEEPSRNSKESLINKVNLIQEINLEKP